LVDLNETTAIWLLVLTTEVGLELI